MPSTYYCQDSGYWIRKWKTGGKWKTARILKAPAPADKRIIPIEVSVLADQFQDEVALTTTTSPQTSSALAPSPPTSAAPAVTPSSHIELEMRVERFIKAKARKDSGSTASIRRAIADQFMVHCRSQGIRWLHDVRSSIVKDFTEAEIERRHLQEQSIRNQLSLLAPLFSEAIQHGEFIGVNPIRAIIKGLKSTADSEPTACITEEEWVALMGEIARRKARPNLKGATCKCPQWVEDAVVVMRRTGLRVTAATSMEFSWADYGHNRLDIPKAFTKGRGKHEYAALLDPTVRAILQRRRLELGSEATRVFPEVRSSRHLYERISYMAKALIKRGEWKRDPKRYNHALRVAFITEALDNGIPLVHVSKLAGHGSTRMTERYNRASSQDAINSAMSSLAQVTTS